MVAITGFEVALVILALVAITAAYYFFKMAKGLAVNAVVGLIVIFLASLIGFGVEISLIVVLLVAFGGLPAALIILLLGNLGIMFTPTILLPLLPL